MHLLPRRLVLRCAACATLAVSTALIVHAGVLQWAGQLSGALAQGHVFPARSNTRLASLPWPGSPRWNR